MYDLKYLPLALQDLEDITTYIAGHLKAPKAAADLLDSLEKSISRLQQFPYSCRLFQAVGPLKAEYRVLPVNNYLVFYVVTEQLVEIHRVIYAKMDLEKQL